MTIINRIIRRLWSGSLTQGQVVPELSIILATTLHEAGLEAMNINRVQVQYEQPDNEMLSFIQNNVFAFALAKSYDMLQEFSARLIGEDGKLKKFSDFKREVLEIHEQYNVDWLRSEYNHAVASGQMAAQWLRYQSEKEVMPYLTFRTAGDDRVRDSHRVLDNITRPVDDPFWDSHYPPLDWGCRCDVTQTNDDRLVSSDRQAAEAINNVPVPAMFRPNVGKTGMIFDEKHPYFKNMGDDLYELNATDHYGMKSIDRIYKGKLPQGSLLKDQSEYSTWWRGMRAKAALGNGVTLSDMNGNKLLIKDEKLLKKGWQRASNLEDVVQKPSEIWQHKNVTHYLRYTKDAALALAIDRELKAISWQAMTPAEAGRVLEQIRKGVLMHR